MKKMEGKKNRMIVRNLLTHTDFSDEQIARLAEVSKEYVEKLRKSAK
ncbi:MAG: hypothetical protein AAGU19_17340 [Prolixibacteraceae bacterium]